MFPSVRSIAKAAVAAIGFLATPVLSSIEEGQSTFIAPSKDLAFGFTIPNDTDTRTSDLYFTIAAAEDTSWAAVGIGSHTMEGALVFMIYQSSDGNNITISTRVSKGWIEPPYEPEFDIETLDSRTENGTMFFSGRCKNCRNWSGGYIDVSSQSVAGIYATGPHGDMKTDDKAAAIRYHWSYGAFNIDLHHATGTAGAPALGRDIENFGAEVVGEFEQSKRDWKSTLHALAMIVTFIGLMPFGILILRVGSSVKWHMVNQSLALCGVVIGAGLGIYDSFYYQRTRGFGTAHQIIGLIVTAFVLGQWALGFLHHRTFKRTQHTTKMAPIHVWLGRFIILLATVNAFLGFPLALTSQRNYILAGFVIAVSLACGAVLFWSGKFKRLLRRERSGQQASGYDPEPWRQVPAHGGSGNQPYDEGNTGYGGAGVMPHTPGQTVGLTDMGTSEYGAGRKERRPGASMGAEQTPRDYV